MTPNAEDPRPVVPTEVRGEGETVVLVPGGLTGWLAWEPHAERLAGERRVVRTQLLSVELGLRGEPLPPGYGLPTESRALERALDEHAGPAADVVAWSYGAAVALDVALTRPERVRSLTLVEPPLFSLLRGQDPLWAEVEAFAREMRAYGPGEVSEAQLERFLRGAGLVPEGADARAQPRWPVWARHRQSLRMGDAPIRHELDRERLRRFERPVLLFAGEGSPGYVRAVVDTLARELPRARVVELPGGHALPMVSMERFLEELRAFLAEAAGAPARPARG